MLHFIVRGESEHQMLFDSVEARKIWFIFSYIVTVSLGSNFESIAKCRLSLRVGNMVSSAVLLGLWNPKMACAFPEKDGEICWCCGRKPFQWFFVISDMESM
jgi:hypothetical protein